MSLCELDRESYVCLHSCMPCFLLWAILVVHQSVTGSVQGQENQWGVMVKQVATALQGVKG